MNDAGVAVSDDGGRFGDVSLATVPSGKLLDRSAYRYWTGREWSTSNHRPDRRTHLPVGDRSWGAAQVVTTTREPPEAYARYLTPRWTDGPDIWFTMSTHGDYRVSLMRARLRAEPPDRPIRP